MSAGSEPILVAPDWVVAKGAGYAQSWLHLGNEWIEKMARYHTQGGRAREMAEYRVRGIASGTHALDWDDNCAQEWGRVAAARLNITVNER